MPSASGGSLSALPRRHSSTTLAKQWLLRRHHDHYGRCVYEPTTSGWSVASLRATASEQRDELSTLAADVRQRLCLVDWSGSGPLTGLQRNAGSGCNCSDTARHSRLHSDDRRIGCEDRLQGKVGRNEGTCGVQR